MVFQRGNPLSWAFNEKYTSAQANLTDAQWPLALDGGAGGTYAPSGLLTFNGGPGIVVASATGRFYAVNCALGGAAAPPLATNAVWMSGDIELVNAATFLCTGGSSMAMDNGTTFEFTLGSHCNYDASSICTYGLNSVVNFDSCFFNVKSGTSADFKSGSSAIFRTGSFVTQSTQMDVTSTGHVNFKASSTLTCEASSVTTLAGSSTHSGAMVQSGAISNTGRISDASGGHYDVIYLETSAATGTHFTIHSGRKINATGAGTVTYTLDDTDAARGSRQEWFILDGSTVSLLQSDGATPIGILGNVSGDYKHLDLVHKGTALGWVITNPGDAIP